MVLPWPVWPLHFTCTKPQGFWNQSQARTIPYILALALENTDAESIQNCVTAVLDQAGRLDVLINNAGVGITDPWRNDLTAVKQHFEVNCFGPMQLIQAYFLKCVNKRD